MYLPSCLIIVLLSNYGGLCDKQTGPDPWHYDDLSYKISSDHNVPPDLKIMARKKIEEHNDVAIQEWFFRSTLGLIVKGGQVKHNDDKSVDITLQLRLESEKWNILDKYLSSATPFTEEMYRRAIGFIQDAVYKPTIKEKIVLAWGEYFHIQLMDYKVYIMWSLAATAGILGFMWLWKYMSQRHLIIFAFIFTYLYEVFTSYKEAEQQEIKRFLNAVDSCKWRFWSSTCDVPQPDPLIFIKYMNPSKIGIRMFTNLISEPMLTINDIVKVVIHGVTDGLWYPFNEIVYGILLLIFNVLIIMLLIMIIFNYIFNIPFSLSLLPFGFLSIRVKQRNRNLLENNQQGVNSPVREINRISDNTLNKLLDVFNKALENNPNNVQPTKNLNSTAVDKNKKLKRSLSAGRISDYIHTSPLAIENTRKRNNRQRINGGGDYF